MSTDVTSVTKSLDRIADALEGGSSGGGSGGGTSEPFIINIQFDSEEPTYETMTVRAEDIYNAFSSGRTCLVNIKEINLEEVYPQYAQYYSDGFSQVPLVTRQQDVGGEKGLITVCFYKNSGSLESWTENADGYPSMSYD